MGRENNLPVLQGLSKHLNSSTNFARGDLGGGPKVFDKFKLKVLNGSPPF